MTILRLAKRVPPCPGGQERHVEELSREQAAAGHEVILVFAQGAPADCAGVRLVHLPAPSSHLPATGGSYLFGRAVRRWLRTHPLSIDLVHTHGDYPEAFLAADVARAADCPAMLTCHASLGVPRPWRNYLRRQAFSRLDHICCVASDVAAQIRALGVRTPLTVQHSGTRLEALRAVPLCPTTHPSLVAVGRLVPLKRFGDLIEAVRMLSVTHPTLQASLLGGGPLEASLQAQAADLPQVTLRGEVDRQAVYETLRTAWLYVISSTTEGLPTTMVEAMAAGLPVVATNVGGIPEMIQEGVHGLLIPPGDPAALAAAIARLLDEPELRRHMAEANTARSAGFDWAHVAAVFTAIGERLLAERSARPR